MLLDCPRCESLLLTKYGTPSPLDGRRRYRCLSCGAHLQPRRFRPFLHFCFVLAVVFPLPLVAVAIWLLIDLGRRDPWLGVRAALWVLIWPGACVWAALLIRRALRAPVPSYFRTTDFPDPRVRLVELTVRIDEDIEPDPYWTAPLREYISHAIQAAGQHLSVSGGAYKVCVKTALRGGRREVTLGYKGRPAEGCLDDLFTEIQDYPGFLTPGGTIAVEMWFKVRP